MIKVHFHPLDPTQTVLGERLLPGDIIQAEDVYDSTCGKWIKSPCPGLMLQEGCTTYWVRKRPSQKSFTVEKSGG